MELETAKKFSSTFNLLLLSLAGVCLIGMMLFIVANAFFREFLSPFKGTSEIVSWLTALTAVLSIGYAQEHLAHISLNLINGVLSDAMKKVNIVFVCILNISFFAIICYHFITYGLHLKEKEAVSETLAFPYYPFIFLASLSFLSLIVTFFIQLTEPVKESEEI